MASTWTAELDALLVKKIRVEGVRFADAARAIGEATDQAFHPHETTCIRRLRALEGRPPRPVFTRVNTSKIRGRVRAPLAERAQLPTAMVLTLPLERVESLGVDGAAREVLFATTPGWEWTIDEHGASDALACARHQATLTGAELVVLERAPELVVAIRMPGDQAGRVFALVVVRARRVREGTS
jgi:hypothetical protein